MRNDGYSQLYKDQQPVTTRPYYNEPCQQRRALPVALEQYRVIPTGPVFIWLTETTTKHAPQPTIIWPLSTCVTVRAHMTLAGAGFLVTYLFV
jgi:hypothetical protein